MDALVVLVPLLPFIAAVLIGIGQLSGLLSSEAGEGNSHYSHLVYQHVLSACPTISGR